MKSKEKKRETMVDVMFRAVSKKIVIGAVDWLGVHALPYLL